MGVISTKAHTVIGLIVGVLLILAPYIFGFADNAAATIVPIVVGLFIIVNELITTSPVSPIKLVPMKVHLVIDVITGIALALSPWIFQFMDSEDPIQWVPHVVVGLMVAGYALLTSTDDVRDKSIAES